MQKAFVVGANYTDLNFAESDASKIADALEKRDYSVTRHIGSEKSSNEIIDDFKVFVKSKEDDTLIFYFAGHGITEDNTLILALNNSDPKDPDSFIDIRQIAYYLEPRYCGSSKILIILDSCKSGKIKDIADINKSDNFFIITAAENWQKTPELEDLEGGAGFISYFIEKALTGDKYVGEKITPQTLSTWLQELGRDYNLSKGKNIVPTITCFGKQQEEFEITKIGQSFKQRIEKLNSKIKDLDKSYFACLTKSRDITLSENERKEHRNESKRIERLLDITVEERDHLIRKLSNQEDEPETRSKDILDDITIKLRELSLAPEKDTNFVGREVEIEAFLDQLLDGKTLGITGFRGMGGVGKTAIAVEVCSIIKESWKENPQFPDYLLQNNHLKKKLLTGPPIFEDGILWIRFERGVKDTEKVLEKIIIQVGGKGLLNKIKDIDELITLLQKKKILVVLDSAEQNTENFWYFHNKFRGKFAILVTSRERFGGIKMVDINKMNEGDAIELFTKYLNKAVSPAEIKSIKKLCKTIDYLPIAIKVLASRAYAFEQSIDKIIQDFEKNKLDMLKIDDPIDEEGKNLDAKVCFSMSLSDLNERTQDVFVQTGVFEFPFSEEAIKTISGHNNVEEELNILVKLSLLSKIHEPEELFDLHPLLKEYAKFLAGEEKLEQIKNAKFKYIEKVWISNKDSKAPITINQNNLLSETQAIIHDLNLLGKHETVLKLAGIIDSYLYTIGLWEQKKEINRIAIKAATATQNEKELAHHLGNLADTLGRQKKFKEATDTYQRALKIHEDLKDIKSALYIKYTLLAYDFYQGKFDYCVRENFKYIHEASARNRSYEIGSFGKNIGWIYNKFYLDNALTAFLTEITRNSDQNERASITYTNSLRTFNDITDTFINKGDYPKALLYIDQSISHALSSGNQELIRVAYERKIFTLIKLGQFPEANSLIESLENQHEEMRDVEEQRDSIFLYKGFIQLHTGNPQKAIKYFEEFPDLGQRSLYLGKAHIALFEKNGQQENLIQAYDFLCNAKNFYTNQKNAVDLAAVYTQFALVDIYNQKRSSAIKNVTIALNTKRKFGIVDTGDEKQVKQKIIANNTPEDIYSELEERHQDLFIELEPDFLITNLPETITGKDGKEMALLPEGRSFFGEGKILTFEPEFYLENFTDFWKGKYDQIQKAQEAYLYPFYIDKGTVTIKEYLDFCNKSGHAKPADLDEDSEEPITEITYTDALAYAKFYNKELPTQPEWEKAMRSMNQAFYMSINNEDDIAVSSIQRILTTTTSKSTIPVEIFQFIVGSGISEYLENNPDQLTGWHELDDFDRRFVYGKSHIYSNLLQDSQPAFSDFSLSKGIEQESLIQVLKLVAYSRAIGGYDKKSSFLEKIPKLPGNKIPKLLDTLFNEVIRLFQLSQESDRIVNNWNSEKRTWELLIKNKLGNEVNFKVQRSVKFEFINSNRIANISLAGNQHEETHTIPITQDEKRKDIGFRCVKPIFSKLDLQKFLKDS